MVKRIIDTRPMLPVYLTDPIYSAVSSSSWAGVGESKGTIPHIFSQCPHTQYSSTHLSCHRHWYHFLCHHRACRGHHGHGHARGHGRRGFASGHGHVDHSHGRVFRPFEENSHLCRGGVTENDSSDAVACGLDDDHDQSQNARKQRAECEPTVTSFSRLINMGIELRGV